MALVDDFRLTDDSVMAKRYRGANAWLHSSHVGSPTLRSELSVRMSTRQVKDSRHGTSSTQSCTASSGSRRLWFRTLLSWCLDSFVWFASAVRFSDVFQCEFLQHCWWVVPLGSVHRLDAADRDLGRRVDSLTSGSSDESRRSLVRLVRRERSWRANQLARRPYD